MKPERGLGEREHGAGREPMERLAGGGGIRRREGLEEDGLQEEEEPAVVLAVEVEIDRELVSGRVAQTGRGEGAEGKRAESGDDEKQQGGAEVSAGDRRGGVAVPEFPSEHARADHVQRGEGDADRPVSLDRIRNEHADDRDLKHDKEADVAALFARRGEVGEGESEKRVEHPAEEGDVRVGVENVAVGETGQRHRRVQAQERAEDCGDEEKTEGEGKGATGG